MHDSGYAPTGSHDTHNTAQSGPSPVDNSICEQSDTTKQPDLMGTQPRRATQHAALQVLVRPGRRLPGRPRDDAQGQPCRTLLLGGGREPNPANNNKWTVHAWATHEFDSTFHLSGRVTVSVFTTTVGGVSGRGFLCATLIERRS